MIACEDLKEAYPSVVTFKTLGLPDGNVDGVDAVANSGDDSRDDHLHGLGCRGLKNRSDNHDPGSPHDTALPAKAIGCQESHDGAEEASNVVDSGDDTLEVGARFVHGRTEGWQVDDRAKYTLIISKELKAEYVSI